MDISGIVSEFLVDMISDLGNKITEIQEVLVANIYSPIIAGRSNFFWGIVTFGYTSTVNIATTICGVIFLIEFLKVTVKLDVLKFEYLFSALFKLCVARLAISVGGTLMRALTYTSIGLVTSIEADSEISSTLLVLQTKVADACSDMELLEAIGLLATLLIPFIAIKIIGLIGIVLAWGRMLELAVYHVVYPLPCAALCMDNASITRRFMLSYLSVGLQGMFMMLSLRIFKSWVLSDVYAIITGLGSADTPYSQISKMVFSLFLAALIMIVALMKSSQWAQKLCGV